jgi:hypothetical protein
VEVEGRVGGHDLKLNVWVLQVSYIGFGEWGRKAMQEGREGRKTQEEANAEPRLGNATTDGDNGCLHDEQAHKHGPQYTSQLLTR